MKKFFRRALTVLLIVAGLVITAIVGAAVQMFDGKGEWHTSDAETEQMAKARASQRAQLDAQKKAGVYLKTFSRTVNLELADDEVSAVTNNITEIVGEVHFDKKIIPLSETQTTILYTATLKAKIDPEGIYDWIKRDEKDKVTIVQQNTQLQDAIQKNDELAESLTEQYNRATTQTERDQIREKMNDADRDFLLNQIFIGSGKSYLLDSEIMGSGEYRAKISARIEVQKKSVPNIKRFLQSINVEIGDEEFDALVYYLTEPLSISVAWESGDFGEGFSAEFRAKVNSSDVYGWINLGRNEKIILLRQYKDLREATTKFTDLIEQYNRAKSKTEKDNIGDKIYQASIIFYSNEEVERGNRYYYKKQYESAIYHYNKAIERTGYGKHSPKNALAYYNRGLCYQQLGDEAKAQADFAKAKELGFNG